MNNSKPLWQRLNEERTQGEWELTTVPFELMTTDSAGTIYGPINKEGGSPIICDFSRSPGDKAGSTNAQYTALAVNNLASLAENLKRILDRIEENDLQVHFQSAYERAKEALNKIS